MTKAEMLARIDQLLPRCDGHVDSRAEPEYAINAALTLMNAAYGPDSEHARTLLTRRDDAASKGSFPAVYKLTVTTAVMAALQNLREEVADGLLSTIERRVTSDVLSDLVRLARTALEEGGDGAKNVAAVLAAAAYEDTLRRIARDHAGLLGRDDLADVITHLKDAGLLVSPQLSIVVGHLNFRNRALHADWDKIDRTSVGSALALVEELLLKHFS